MIKVFLLFLAAVSAWATYNPPSNIPQLNQEVYQNYRVDKIEDKEEAKKKEEAAKPPQITDSRPTPSVPLILSGSEYDKINQFRASKGLSPVSVSSTLAASAAAHSNCMASSCGFNHSNYSGEVIGFSCGYRMDIVSEWIASPGHNAILSGNYTSVGYSEVSTGGCWYFTAHFG